MHRTWLVPELAARIAEECAPGFKDRVYTNYWESAPHFDSLCALARTCRTLSEPALNIIWYHQCGLCMLVQSIFPSDLLDEVSYALPDALDGDQREPKWPCRQGYINEHQELVSNLL